MFNQFIIIIIIVYLFGFFFLIQPFSNSKVDEFTERQ